MTITVWSSGRLIFMITTQQPGYTSSGKVGTLIFASDMTDTAQGLLSMGKVLRF